MMFSPVPENKRIPWKKGEVAYSQPEVYRKLPKGYGIYFYEEGSYERGTCRIEMAIDAIPIENWHENFEKIFSDVKEGAKGRSIGFFNQ